MIETLRIVIVEDIELFRRGLAMVINRFDNAHVIAEASTGKEFLDMLDSIKPDIVLVDIELPDISGIKLTELALMRYPNLKMVALTMFGDDAYINNMMKVGARGFLLKNIGKEELKKALDAIAKGRIYYSEGLMPYFYNKITSANEEAEIKIVFSKREIEILNLIAQGLTDNEIGEKLFLSPRTINGYRNNMIFKTGSKNTVNLIINCIKNNIIEL